MTRTILKPFQSFYHPPRRQALLLQSTMTLNPTEIAYQRVCSGIFLIECTNERKT